MCCFVMPETISIIMSYVLEILNHDNRSDNFTYQKGSENHVKITL